MVPLSSNKKDLIFEYFFNHAPNLGSFPSLKVTSLNKAEQLITLLLIFNIPSFVSMLL